jgi:hypothetical protein
MDTELPRRKKEEKAPKGSETKDGRIWFSFARFWLDVFLKWANPI